MPTETTAERVLRQCNLKFEKVVGSDQKQYRGNSPFRSDSDSKGFTLVVSACGEKGAYIDHARDNERGSLYELAERLGIVPTRHEVGSSKRPYRDMADYAQQHGVEPDVLTDAGWTEGTYQGRKCLIIPTANGKRYRFLDGDKPSYKSELHYTRCWFGLDRAIAMQHPALVLCNGEVSTLVGQHYGVPAFAQTGGESRLSEDLLNELKRKWSGPVYIALDCDKAGQDATTKIHEQLPEAIIINLNLSDGGDLADFCKLYTSDSFAELQRRVGVKTPPPKPADDTISESFQTLAVVSRDEFVGLQSGKVKRLGLQSKIPDLDAVVGTFMPARIHLILGATGMGKSTLGVSLALAFMWQAPGLVVSTETPPRLWIAKCAAMKANVPVDRILEGTATNTEATAIQDAYHSLYKKPVRVLKTVSPDIGDIEDWVKRWVKPLGAKWLLIDSISRVIAKGKHNIFDKTTEVSNRLQSLTLETGLSVVTTSQVGRHLRDRANKIPTIQDGYGSGALEQDADVVMALYYHDYYVRQGLVDANTLYPPGKALLQVGKHRWRNVDNQQVFMHFRGGVGFYPWEKERAVIAPPLPLAVANDIDMWS